MDEIRIERLRVYANHGYYEEEKQYGQYFEIDAVLRLSLQNAGMTDCLEDTVNYALVCAFLSEEMIKRAVDLIETVAEELAVKLLNRYKMIQEIELEVRKPEVPMEQKVSCVSVRVFRKRHLAYIALGSNQGDSKSLINQAVELIRQDERCNVKRVSQIIKSTPYGGVEQDDFYNGVMEVETYYEPQILLEVLLKIEDQLGRKREVHWGPRTIDLDIIFYDQMIIEESNLVIPHPDMANRDFVLQPLTEIVPYLRHPVLNKTVAELSARLQESGERHVCP